MASRIHNHFPVVRFRDVHYADNTLVSDTVSAQPQQSGHREKYWFNPVTKSLVADRPEERVRLRMIEFLTREAGFSLNRMSAESTLPIRSRHKHTFGMRTDLICFDELHRPLLLVECKAESVSLDELTAMQGARYNDSVKAPYILLTNGVNDLLFAVREDRSIDLIDDFARVFQLLSEPPRDISYWIERGFWHGDQHSNADTPEFLNRFWTSPHAVNQYIEVPVPEDLLRMFSGLSPKITHFFRVFPQETDGSRSALSVQSQGHWTTHDRSMSTDSDNAHSLYPHAMGWLLTSRNRTIEWTCFKVASDSDGLYFTRITHKKPGEKCTKISDYQRVPTTDDVSWLNLLKSLT